MVVDEHVQRGMDPTLLVPERREGPGCQVSPDDQLSRKRRVAPELHAGVVLVREEVRQFRVEDPLAQDRPRRVRPLGLLGPQCSTRSERPRPG